MENSYVARAKALMMDGARKSALMIVPLAAAVSAQGAAVTLATSPVYCKFQTFGSSTSNCGSTGSATQKGAGGQGVEGITITTGDPSNYYSGGMAIHFIYGDGSYGSSVSGSGIAATSINVAYDFSLHFNPQSSGSITGWTLVMGIVQDNNTTASKTFTGTGLTHNTGTGSIALTSTISSADRVQVDLSYTYTVGCAFCSLNTGADSGSKFTFSDVAASATPEPATFGSLLLAGLGAVATRFRRRRN